MINYRPREGATITEVTAQRDAMFDAYMTTRYGQVRNALAVAVERLNEFLSAAACQHEDDQG